jgi:hypothetical protein
MNYPNYDTRKSDAIRALIAISEWIDEAPRNAARDQEALTWSRLAKIQEEAGEVVSEFIAYTGQNPRKPQDDGALVRVFKELLDVAATALAAYEHLNGHQGRAVEDLFDHIIGLKYRALAAPVQDEAFLWNAEQIAAVAAASELPRTPLNVSATNAYDVPTRPTCPMCGSHEGPARTCPHAFHSAL